VATNPRTDQATKVLNEAVEGLADVADYLKRDPVPPVWRELKRYSLTKLKADATAGLMVAIVTIPQAIGFALPDEHHLHHSGRCAPDGGARPADVPAEGARAGADDRRDPDCRGILQAR
jgi:hypothetical protein